MFNLILLSLSLTLSTQVFAESNSPVDAHVPDSIDSHEVVATSEESDELYLGDPGRFTSAEEAERAQEAEISSLESYSNDAQNTETEVNPDESSDSLETESFHNNSEE